MYRQVLAVAPRHPVALHLLGMLAGQAGHRDAAMDLIRQAVAVHPEYAEAHNSLGMLMAEAGRVEDAAACFRKAVTAVPSFADGHCNLGNTLKSVGRLDEAAACYQRALALRPDLIPAGLNLAVTLCELDRCAEAEACCRQVLAAQPKLSEAHNILGAILAKTGKIDAAVAAYAQAVSLRPNNGDAQLNLAVALLRQGRAVAAVSACRQALTLMPGHDGAVGVLADAMARVDFQAVGEPFLADLCALLDHPVIAPRRVDELVMRALRLHPDLLPLLRQPQTAEFRAVAPRLGAIRLLLQFMAQTIVPAVDFERLFTRLRATMLAAWRDGGLAEAEWPLAAALAHQAFIADYAWLETDGEAAEAAALAEDNGRPDRLLVLAAYRPLHRCAHAQAIADASWPDAVESVVVRQVREPLAERQAAQSLPAITPVADGVSRAVQSQYEEHPYPRWSKFPRLPAAAPGEPFLRRLPARPDILVAGCGTGYQALVAAASYPGARVLAVDLSRTSLAFAVRKTRELGVESIEYAQADILNLGSLDRRFDVIECIGVLHHMDNPLAGWRVLAGLLKPGGLMKIGLYSELARAPHVQARAMIAERGYASDADGIRRARRAIMDDAAPQLAGLLNSRDFYNLSECRDLIFHVQESRYTIPRLQAELTQLGLEFLDFVHPDPAVGELFRRTYPGVAADRALECWDAFERGHPDTFRQMYQFWVCRKD